MGKWVEVAREEEVPRGEARAFEVEGEMVAVYNVNGIFYASTNVCPHQGGPLGEGTLDGRIITCPLHGWQFNVENGTHCTLPGMKVRTYPAKAENGRIWVEIEE